MTGLLLVLAAVLVAPWPGRRGGRLPRPGARAGADRGVARAGPWLATAAVGAAAVALGGVGTGAAVAVVCCPATAFVLIRLRGRPVPLPVDRSVALALDLVATALRAGRPTADALAAGAAAAPAPVERALGQVAGLLRLGAAPAQAWAVLARDGPLGPVATAAERSATSGVRLAGAFERVAREIRADAAAAATARAHRAGVQAMGPLAACFLPSFVCLGVVPVIVGVARTVLGVLP